MVTRGQAMTAERSEPDAFKVSDGDDWWGPNGFRLVSCVVDFRPGGAARACIRSPEGGEHWVAGVSLEIFEPERIVLRGHLEIEGESLSRSGGYVTFRRL
jgi:uncharacterized protein YndB with AHSA1/START domain